MDVKGNTYGEVLGWASSFLEASGGDGHAPEYILLARQNWEKMDLMKQLNQPVPPNIKAQIVEDLTALAQHMPPQYITGSEEFYGRRFRVTRDTLIPRPETEELVDLCLKEHESFQKYRVLDVGTGTGVIGVTLKLERPHWSVTATDISPAALLVAEENCQTLGVDVRFLQGDLTAPIQSETFDLILSNPPYISHAEWVEMDPSVRTYEPKNALFAEHDGLLIYQRLAAELPLLMTPMAEIYLEIGYQQGAKVKEIFQQAFPNKKIALHQDIAGQDRMIHVY